MDSTVTLGLITLAGTVVTTAGTVTAAVLTNRSKAPGGEIRLEPVKSGSVQGGVRPMARDSRSETAAFVSAAALGTPTSFYSEVPGRISRAFWLGIASLFLCWLPVIGMLTIVPGLYIGLRDRHGPRKRVRAGLIMLWIALAIQIAYSIFVVAAAAHPGGYACYYGYGCVSTG
jgi:hypothetical protein